MMHRLGYIFSSLNELQESTFYGDFLLKVILQVIGTQNGGYKLKKDLHHDFIYKPCTMAIKTA